MQVRAPQEDRYDEALTDAPAWWATPRGARRAPARPARRAPGAPVAPRRGRDARLRPGAPRTFTVAPVPDALQDRRVEITGPTSRKMVINALNSARAVHGGLRGLELAHWSNMVEGQVNLADAIRGSDRARRERQGLRARRRSGRAARPAARAAPGRGAPPDQAARRRRVHGLRPVRAPQRRGAARARLGPVLLHPEAGVAPRGGAGATRS